MISPHEFRRYRYFTDVPDEMLIALANSSSLRLFKTGERLLEEGDVARYLMIVKSGQVDIIYQLGDNRQVFAESAISGDMIGWSAVLDPYQLTASAVGSKDGELIQIEGIRIREMCDTNVSLGYQLMTEIAKGLRDRLTGLRVQIAASK
jgi:CRP/FNR family transcriptional regulator, cyclic AMP receptor protein